ncbi:MAG TPA: response regulator [Ktedonobacterales bacterium]|nr:response regulator [Ktedonobacterales bacterium]
MNAADEAAYTVLIVDDNPLLLEFMQDVLQEMGDFTVVTASNGVEGLEQFYQTRPDCAVIDVKMPGLTGYQLVRALRGDPETAQTPLILLTALAQDTEQFAGLAAGADQYLRKPIDPLDLVQAIQHAIQISDDQRQQRFQLLAEEQASDA